jgi:hypothetical protein
MSSLFLARNNALPATIRDRMLLEHIDIAE